MQVWISFHTKNWELDHGWSNVTELKSTALRRVTPDWNMNRAIWESDQLSARYFKTSLPLADLQVLNTRIYVGNTHILQSFTAIASHCVYLEFNGANVEHPWQPCGALSAQTRSWKSLSPVVHSHYCTCIFYFTHKRSKACQQAACLLRHTMHGEK